MLVFYWFRIIIKTRLYYPNPHKMCEWLRFVIVPQDFHHDSHKIPATCLNFFIWVKHFTPSWYYLSTYTYIPKTMALKESGIHHFGFLRLEFFFRIWPTVAQVLCKRLVTAKYVSVSEIRCYFSELQKKNTRHIPSSAKVKRLQSESLHSCHFFFLQVV